MPNTSTPIISIIVATYNRAHLLRSCLEALHNQTCNKKYYEVLLGDNASKDETALVVKEFEKRDWNMRYFYEKRQGLSFVRNSGFRLAKAEWVAYIDLFVCS